MIIAPVRVRIHRNAVHVSIALEAALSSLSLQTRIYCFRAKQFHTSGGAPGAKELKTRLTCQGGTLGFCRVVHRNDTVKPEWKMDLAAI